jgi:hypothetical protein
MFVKIVRVNRELNQESESLHQCEAAFWDTVEDGGRKMLKLTLDSAHDSKTFMLDTIEENFHVFTMNDNGKTIDRRFVGPG